MSKAVRVESGLYIEIINSGMHLDPKVHLEK